MTKKMTMTKKNADRILEGMAEAIAHAAGKDIPEAQIHIPVEIDVQALRRELGLTQSEFADRFGFSLGAVRDWEQGRAIPDQSTRAYLKVIRAEPAIVERVLERA